jgi:small subunit ribosomal protein S20
VANKKSAEKRIRQTLVRRTRNRAAMSSLRTTVKKARLALDAKAADAATLVKSAVAAIDKAVTKGVLKRETASRYISRLTLRSNKAA